MNAAVTIVLPVHNAERSLRESLLQMLELAEVTGRRIQVAVVDDGSTDATYEIACELATQFPQVRVLRQPYQRGLGGALEQVRTRLGVEQVVAHDGVTPIDHRELAELLAAPAGQRPVTVAPSAEAASEGRGSRRVAAIASLNSRLAEPHRSGASFRWLRLDEPVAPRRKRAATPVLGAALDGLMGPRTAGSGTIVTPRY